MFVSLCHCLGGYELFLIPEGVLAYSWNKDLFHPCYFLCVWQNRFSSASLFFLLSFSFFEYVMESKRFQRATLEDPIQKVIVLSPYRLPSQKIER